MSATDTFIVGEELPRIESVSVHEGFRIAVSWASGSRAGRSDVVDLGPDIFSYKLYAPLRDHPELFRTVHVINYGSALGWGDGDSIDMSAEGVEELAEQAMSSVDFKAFLDRNKLTQEGAAAQLGISRRQVNYYLTSKAVPRTVALACAYIDQRSDTTAALGGTAVAMSQPVIGSPPLPARTVIVGGEMAKLAPELSRALGKLRTGLRTAIEDYAASGGLQQWSSLMSDNRQIIDPDYALIDLRTVEANKPVLTAK